MMFTPLCRGYLWLTRWVGLSVTRMKKVSNARLTNTMFVSILTEQMSENSTIFAYF